jgi:integrase
MSAHSWVVLAEDYLALRRQLGFGLHIEGEELLRFARYADDVGHRGPLTIDLAVRWATQPSEDHHRYRARRLDVVRRFATHRRIYDPQTEVPPMGFLGPSNGPRPVPHIYSDEEIAALLKETAKLRPSRGLGPHTYATLFGLLSSTGLRVSEALRLGRTEVDLTSGVLTVIETKFHRSRLVPMHPSTVKALQAYAMRRDREVPDADPRVFFVTNGGTPLKYRHVSTAFKRIRHRLGWVRDHGRLPRIHDLRHSFAVKRLLRWYDEGRDISQHIIQLSTYLGHVKLKDTYWYLTAIPALMAAAGDRFEAAAWRGGRP